MTRFEDEISLTQYATSMKTLFVQWEALLVKSLDNGEAYEDEIDHISNAIDEIKQNIVDIIDSMQPDQPKGA